MGLTSRDTLDTATASQTADSGLGNALNVVAKNLPVALGTTLAEALAALAAYYKVSNVQSIHKMEKGEDKATHVQSFCRVFG